VSWVRWAVDGFGCAYPGRDGASMNAWVSLFPAAMAVLWLVLFLVVGDDPRGDTALICANIWGCVAIMIGVLQ
jgi:hypothetical protein